MPTEHQNKPSGPGRLFHTAQAVGLSLHAPCLGPELSHHISSGIIWASSRNDRAGERVSPNGVWRGLGRYDRIGGMPSSATHDLGIVAREPFGLSTTLSDRSEASSVKAA